MNRPIIPLPGDEIPECSKFKTGEGAQTALAAMIRKRQMGENHVEVESAPHPLGPAASEP